MTKLSRRALLAGGVAAIGSAALGNPLDRSLRPRSRPIAGLGVKPVLRPDFADLIERAELSGTVAFVLRDLATGEVITDQAGGVPLPPASVTKALTALFAIETLGPAYRFTTTIYATGPIIDGVVEGDLVLAGGGDPRLDTDQLILLRDQIEARGITEVRGRLLVWGGALPKIEEIEPSQMDHLGYNPAISGLNLNFNRVHFEWERRGSSYRTQMDGRSETVVPLVDMSRVQLVDRNVPVFAYEGGVSSDRWTVARSALNNRGSRWLPVRHPALYTGDVFQALAAFKGLQLPEPELVMDLPEGEVVASLQSETLSELMRGMLKYSTNLTAEIAGLSATKSLTGHNMELQPSAQHMTGWLNERAGIDADFKDHSGLNDQTRITADSMTDFLMNDGVYDVLNPILKPIQLLDQNGDLVQGLDANVQAKTGTLNFVSTLAGYVQTASGRRFAFTFFAADVERREAGKRSGDELPTGALSYNTKAKKLQQTLLRHVATRFKA